MAALIFGELSDKSLSYTQMTDDSWQDAGS